MSQILSTIIIMIVIVNVIYGGGINAQIVAVIKPIDDVIAATILINDDDWVYDPICLYNTTYGDVINWIINYINTHYSNIEEIDVKVMVYIYD